MLSEYVVTQHYEGNKGVASACYVSYSSSAHVLQTVIFEQKFLLYIIILCFYYMLG